jgi:hypothetical protein
MSTHHIHVREINNSGRFEARLEGGELLCVSRQPFLDGARELLARGADPDDQLVMVTATGTESLSAKVAVAAHYAVEEATNGSGPRFPDLETISTHRRADRPGTSAIGRRCGRCQPLKKEGMKKGRGEPALKRSLVSRELKVPTLGPGFQSHDN